MINTLILKTVPPQRAWPEAHFYKSIPLSWHLQRSQDKPNMAPRWLQDAPKRTSRRPKMDPLQHQMRWEQKQRPLEVLESKNNIKAKSKQKVAIARRGRAGDHSSDCLLTRCLRDAYAILTRNTYIMNIMVHVGICWTHWIPYNPEMRPSMIGCHGQWHVVQASTL